MSFHALESKKDENDDKQWLTYWVVFGAFNIIDQFAGFVLHFIPFYYVLKLVVLILLFHPKFQGATWVYNNYIQEYATHIVELDEAAKKAIGEHLDAGKKAFGEAANMAKAKIGMKSEWYRHDIVT